MTSFREHIRLWALWMLVMPVAFLANPLGEFGWLELGAVLAPLALLVERRITRELALAAGLPGLTLIWLFAPGTTSIVQMFVAWAVFGVGVLLASRAIQSQSEIETIAGQVAYVPDDAESIERFRIAVDRELGRARRHDRPFAILSAAAHPRSLEADASGLYRTELLRTLAENRARLELRDFLSGDLHVYSDVAIDGARVLALVPEVDVDALELLLERLRNAADESLSFDVQIGASQFPRDALCAEDLIDVADRNRTTSKLRSLPERIAVRDADLGAWRSPDVQG